MLFNNKREKTEYLVITGNKNRNKNGKLKQQYDLPIVTNTVKKGAIERVAEHKLVGSWFDESGSYGININKRKEKLGFMISTTNREGHPNNVGRYAVDARLKLAETVVITSQLNCVEGFPSYTTEEMKELEKMQHKILVGILELPISTPYYGLLMETGWWKMSGRVAYKKMMLYHNIVTSNNKRVTKKLIHEQQKMKRKTTWYAGVKELMERCEIELVPEETLKSTWKAHVKKKIGEAMEREIVEECRRMKKTRTVMNDKYEKKDYLKSTGLKMTKTILKTRLHMTRIAGNYKGRGEGTCGLCKKSKGTTEHYFECPGVNQLVEAWGVQEEDLRSQDIQRLKGVAKFMEHVQWMVAPTMNNEK